MYTKDSHIVVYFQTISGIDHVRVIPISHLQNFFNELETIYNIKQSISDENIFIFYNCGDLYERLVNDLKFKKFKNTLFKEVCSSIWSLDESNSENKTWFTETLKPWIKTRLNTYIDDMDEEPYTNYIKTELKKFNWDFTTEEYVSISTTDDKLVYNLKQMEVTKNGEMVLTLKHIMTLLALYSSDNYGIILHKARPDLSEIIYSLQDKVLDEPESEELKLVISEMDYMRGIIINKDKLSNSDIGSILEYLNINNENLFQFVMSHEFSKLQKDVLDVHASYIPLESNFFGQKYSPINDFELNKCDGDLECFGRTFYMNNDPIDNKLAYSKLVDSNPVDNKLVDNKPIISKANNKQQNKQQVVFYKNLLNNIINVFENNLIICTLKEFEKVSTFSYESDMTKQVVDIINQKIITKKFIEELFELVKLFNVDELVEEEPVLETKVVKDVQHIMTKVYVDRYKNDSAETLASIVTDNVFNYLKDSCLHENYINKNKIGQDLVDLGVKKTRKAKGFVYGIDDSTKLPYVDKNLEKQIFEPDISKVEKKSQDLRATPISSNIDLSLFRNTIIPASFYKFKDNETQVHDKKLNI